MITVYAFRWVPDFARGQVRDVRVRWALEEAGIPYETHLLVQGDQDKPEYRAIQPFGQVPVIEEDGNFLFESGAIALHLGVRSDVLLPAEPNARARATQWVLAALNSVEPFIGDVVDAELFHAGEPWAEARLPGATEIAKRRIGFVSKSLGDKTYLDGDTFTVGDLIMTTVLGIKRELIDDDPRLKAYVDRCTSRPAYQRAMDAHLADLVATPEEQTVLA